jgi:ketosteroid isomerase-like protein
MGASPARTVGARRSPSLASRWAYAIPTPPLAGYWAGDVAGERGDEQVGLKADSRSQAGVATSDDSVEVVRKAWEAWERGDMQAVFDFYDPAVEWDMSESDVPDMGVFRGHDGVRRFFREWMAPFHDYYAHAEDFRLGSEGVLVRMRQGGRGKESGVDVEMPPLWQLYRLRAGRAVRVEIYRDEDRALEAAGLRK